MNRFKLFLLIILLNSIYFASAQVDNCANNTTLKWSTYQGGNGEDEVVDLFVHPATKKIYTIAKTNSTNLIATNGDIGLGGSDKAYIQCMNNDGTLIWSTLISGWETPHNIYVTDTEEVILFGQTTSGNLPMIGPGLDKSFDGSSDMVYLKLNSAGTVILSSSFIGGNGFELIAGVNTNIEFHNNSIIGIVSTSSTDIVTSANALSSLPGEAFIFSYDYAVELLNYSSYYLYSISSSFSGTESLHIDQNGIIHLFLWNKSEDFNMNSDFITTDGLFTSYSNYGYNFPPIFIKLDNNFDFIYGSYISNFIIDDPVLPGEYPVFNAFVGTHHYYGFDIETDSEDNVYFLQQSIGFRGPIVADLTSILQTSYTLGPNPFHGNGDFFIGTNIIKLKLDAGNYTPEYVHNLSLGQFDSNDYQFEIDKYDRIHLFLSDKSKTYKYEDQESQSYSFPYDNSSELLDYRIYKKSTDVLDYNINPGDGAFSVDNNPDIKFSNLYIDANNFYIVGKHDELNYPVTPSWRDTENNVQTFVQQLTYGGGDSDGFVTVIHSPVPEENSIADFSIGENSFCEDSYIHQNFGPIDGSPFEWLCGDGSLPSHLVPNFTKGATTYSHPILSPINGIQWQKSYDNINWQDISGAVQEDYDPEPEQNAGQVYYRRIFRQCCADDILSNSIEAQIVGSTDMEILFNNVSYEHCPGISTTLDVIVNGGSGDVSWQWYNGYAPTTDIVPANGSSTNGITASVDASVTQGGVYRLVVIDNNSGCAIEQFVTVKIPTVSMVDSYSFCPNQTTCLEIRPTFFDPDYSFFWQGPNGFTSTDPQICVSDLGTYVLTINGCTSSSVTTVLETTPHDVNLTTIPDYQFCQGELRQQIGMSTTQPAGYSFQWAPGQNVVDILAFTPDYDPKEVPPNSPQLYTFSAIRDSDGCVFEETLDITVIERAELDQNLESPFLCDGTEVLDVSATGNYFEWEIISTSFPGGLSALISDGDFSFDGIVNSVFAFSPAPILNFPNIVNSYTITISAEASFLPLPSSCSTTRTYVLNIAPTCIPGTVLYHCDSFIDTNLGQGSNSNTFCGAFGTSLVVGNLTGASYFWEVIEIDGNVVTNVPLFALFDTNGTALNSTGPLPNTIFADIDNPTPGLYGFVRYQVTTTMASGYTCSDEVVIYSKSLFSPVVDLIPSVDVCGLTGGALMSGSTLPLTIDGSFYNSAPNTNINWQWSGSGIQNGTTPFPVLTSGFPQTYTATAQDIISGCSNSDQIEINIEEINGFAGDDLIDVCPNSLIQLEGPFNSNPVSYSWSPPVGLNFPIGTPNNEVRNPYATINDDIIYTLTTESQNCVVEDQLEILTSSNGPPAIPSQTYDACNDSGVIISNMLSSNCTGCTFNWSLVSGGSLSWFDNVNIAEPIITIPDNEPSGVVMFELSMTKGDCGTSSGDIIINIQNATKPILGPDVDIECSLPLSPITVTNHMAGNSYEWTPQSNSNGGNPTLYEDANMTIPYLGGLTTLSTLYVYTPTSETYAVVSNNSGCISDPEFITVTNTDDLEAFAGSDLTLCSSQDIGSLGGPNIYPNGTAIEWEAVELSSDPDAQVFNAASPNEQLFMASWLNGLNISNPIFDQSVGINQNQTGSFVYKLTLTFGNCTNVDYAIVRIYENNFPTNFVGQSNIVCQNECFYLLSNPLPGYSYTWSASPTSELANMNQPYSNNPEVCPQGDVTYSVYLTDIMSGCTSPVEYVSYTIFPSPAINDHYEEVCQFGSTYDVTSFITNYNQLTNPIWELNDGSGTVIANPSNYIVNQDVELIVRDQNQYGCMVEAVVTFENLSAGLNADSFYHLVGNTDNNQSKRVKFYDDHIYLAYNNVINSLPRASMIKYDRQGNLIWHTSLDYTSSLNDFVLDEECQIMAVGYKDQFSVSSPNESIIVRFDADNGNVIMSQTERNGGRHEFTKIVRQTVGANTNYYISGTQSGPNPSNVDRTSLHKYSINGAFLFKNFYTNDLSQLDEESHRGLLELSDGSIILMGNDGPTGKGIIMKVNGSNGDFIDGLFTDQIIDFYDAVETPNGNIILVGEKFDSDEGIVVLMDQNLNFLSSQLFSNITDFRNIIHTAGDNYLLAGKTKGTLNYPVLFSIDYSSYLFTVNNGYYVENFESDYESVWFDYDPINNKVAYVDNRINNPNGFGDYDMLLGIFDIDLFTPCTQVFTPLATSNPVTTTSVNFDKYDFTFSSGTASYTTNTNLFTNDIVCGCDDNAISFDGIDDHLSTTGFSTNGDYTISAWFNNDMVSNGTAEDRILSFGPSNRLEIGIEEDSGGATDGFLWIYDQGLGSVQTFGQNIRDGMWHHVGVVRSGNNVDVFLDGVMVGSYPSNTGYSHGPNLSIGNWANIGSPSFFKGSIDEVSIWDVALSANDIAELMSCKLLGYETGLVSYYDMNQGTPGANNTAITQILDSGPGGNDLDILYMSLDGQNSNIVCSAIGLGNSCDICTHPDLPGLQSFYDAANGDQWTNTINNDKTWFEDCDPCGLLDGTPWFGITCDGNDRVSQLRMNSNSLTGIITPDIDLLPRLRWFVAYNNSLSGEIPSTFCSLDLLHFRAPVNNFTGTIPSCFDQIPNLTSIVAYSNNFTGPLPVFTSSTLGQLQINDNGFTGTIPVSYASLPLLNTLDLSNNNLSGCYDLALEGICTSTLLTTNQNQYISAGNTFNAAWEDFCATGDGQCCETDIILDAANLVSGEYSASSSITVSGCINPPLDITFNAPTVTYDIDFEVKLGATVSTLLTGCQ